MILLLALPSWAFGPDTDVYVGQEPTRIRRERAEVQAGFLRSAGWRRFAEGEGRGWQARFDEATGTPRHLWGGGVAIDTRSADTVGNDVERFLERHAALLGFEPGDLSLRSASYNERYDTWYVDLDALRDGTPTYRGGFSARVKHGNLVYLRVGTAPRAEVTGAWRVDADAAIAAAIADGPAPAAVHTEQDAVRELLELQSTDGLELRRAFRVRTRTADPPGIWVTFVDAETGEVLHVHNEVRFATGTVTGRHHLRTVDGTPLVTSPMPLVLVETSTDLAVADAAGVFSITDDTTYTTDLHGDYVDVDVDGPDGVIVSPDPDMEWTTDDATQAEIDSYVFLHQVRDFALSFAPDVEMSTQSLVSNVNLPATCNAYWDGNVNFFQAGGGCNNTGQIADVNYHEWGHGFHYWSIEAGDFDGSLSEGAADCISFFMTGDHEIAPYFGTSGWAIRDVAPDRVYPDDFVQNDYYVHENGLIFGGAVWDLWELLKDDYGDTAGTDIALSIFAGLLKGGSDVPGSYYEALVADDDDGNVTNGTPHQCQIMSAFGRHGLGTLEGGTMGFVPSHEPLANVPADEPIAIHLDILESVAECVDGAPRDATLWYRINGRQWKDVGASINGNSIDAEIPAQELGTFVEYWVDGSDTGGNAFRAPYSGEFAPYSVFVGGALEIVCEDFEADDGGFRHALTDGEEQEGADDWMWGPPGGLSGDPASGYSGTSVWGNDLGGGNFNGEYQPSIGNRLRSKKYDTGHYTGVFLQYRRWLNVEDGVFDQAVVTANGEQVWSNHDSGSESAGEHHQDRQWVSHSVDLDGIGDRTPELQIGWELHSDGGLELGGWTLDDFCLYAPATADNRLGIVDFVATSDTGPVGFTWTNPPHEPVERVLVVRSLQGFPTSWEDGEVVVDLTDPVAGEAVEASHANGDGRSGYYAVYASDGDEWLSWTIEGWNAAYVEPHAGLAGQDGDGKGGGCGCNGAPGGAALAPLVGLLLLRRRR